MYPAAPRTRQVTGPPLPEAASAIGAATTAGVGAGLWPDYATACDRVVRLGDTIPCDPQRAALYDRLYARYAALYPARRPRFHDGG